MELLTKNKLFALDAIVLSRMLMVFATHAETMLYIAISVETSTMRNQTHSFAKSVVFLDTVNLISNYK